jgi:hypothetical protein
VRFANGPFVDLHQADEEGPVFLGLGGDARAAQEIARERPAAVFGNVSVPRCSPAAVRTA